MRLKRDATASEEDDSSAGWRCTIKVRKEEDADGIRLQGGSRQEELLKADITDEYQLEMYIIAAQVMTLQPCTQRGIMLTLLEESEALCQVRRELCCTRHQPSLHASGPAGLKQA